MSAFCAVLIWERFSQQDESRSSVVFFLVYKTPPSIMMLSG